MNPCDCSSRPSLTTSKTTVLYEWFAPGTSGVNPALGRMVSDPSWCKSSYRRSISLPISSTVSAVFLLDELSEKLRTVAFAI